MSADPRPEEQAAPAGEVALAPGMINTPQGPISEEARREFAAMIQRGGTAKGSAPASAPAPPDQGEQAYATRPLLSLHSLVPTIETVTLDGTAYELRAMLDHSIGKQTALLNAYRAQLALSLREEHSVVPPDEAVALLTRLVLNIDPTPEGEQPVDARTGNAVVDEAIRRLGGLDACREIGNDVFLAMVDECRDLTDGERAQQRFFLQRIVAAAVPDLPPARRDALGNEQLEAIVNLFFERSAARRAAAEPVRRPTSGG